MSFDSPGCPWSSFPLGPMITCEQRLCSWVRQPLNTASNLAFLGVGIFLLVRGIQRQKGGRLERDFGIMTLIIALCSTAAHATQTSYGSLADFMSQFIFFAYLLAYNARRILDLSSRGSRLLMAGSLLLSYALTLIHKRAGIAVFALLAVAYLVSEFWGIRRKPARDFGALYKGLGLIGIAIVAFGLDAAKVGCEPDNHWFQLHSVWHVLVAASIVYAARYYGQFEITAS